VEDKYKVTEKLFDMLEKSKDEEVKDFEVINKLYSKKKKKSTNALKEMAKEEE